MITTPKERVKLGRSRRERVSRAAQAQLHPKQRQFDPIDVLRYATEGRVPQLLPIKYARMKVSPFAFFRGAVSIMAADLGRLPNSGLHAQLCGDAAGRGIMVRTDRLCQDVFLMQTCVNWVANVCIRLNAPRRLMDGSTRNARPANI